MRGRVRLERGGPPSRIFSKQHLQGDLGVDPKMVPVAAPAEICDFTRTRISERVGGVPGGQSVSRRSQTRCFRSAAAEVDQR